MIPSVFISSTIEDLAHLRDLLRDAVLEAGFNPVLSEQGGVGYLPNVSVVESCILAIQQCQLVVLVVGKRYGHITKDDLSVTHAELRAARERRIPVICLVERDLLAYKKVFDGNREGAKPNFPDMDAPERTFRILDEFTSSPVNNGFVAFSSATEARQGFKRQLAHYLGDLMSRPADPIAAEVKDVLAEIKALRQQLAGPPTQEQQRLLRAVRFLLEGHNSLYRDLVTSTSGSIDQAIPKLLEAGTFKAWAEAATAHPVVVSEDLDLLPQDPSQLKKKGFRGWAFSARVPGYSPDNANVLVYAFSKQRALILNQDAFETFHRMHKALLEFAAGQ